MIRGEGSGEHIRIGIAISRTNDLCTRNLLEGALEALRHRGVRDDDIVVVWVPGAFELPLALRRMAEKSIADALIALGVVIQGATDHADIINREIAASIARISGETGIPIVHGVIGAQTLEHALERSGGKHGNRGWIAAEVAIEMANLVRKLNDEGFKSVV
jgi:6,7-dimethyl-8-ribityllumazine synthase